MHTNVGVIGIGEDCWMWVVVALPAGGWLGVMLRACLLSLQDNIPGYVAWIAARKNSKKLRGATCSTFVFIF